MEHVKKIAVQAAVVLVVLAAWHMLAPASLKTYTGTT